MNSGVRELPRQVWEAGAVASDTDVVVAEVAVALVYNGVSHVVMMATPQDLADLGLGFSLSEGIIDRTEELLDWELQERQQGLELAMTIPQRCFASLKQRRRNLTGRTGCGLCGLESLQQALPPIHRVAGDCSVAHSALQRAAAGLREVQSLNRLTGSVHGAAWCSEAGEICLLREDVGRHNALDKLLGAMALADLSGPGFALVTSRASYEMVAKAASRDIPMLAAVSGPTSLAIERADQCGLTLVGFVQPGRQVIYTHAHRLATGA